MKWLAFGAAFALIAACSAGETDNSSFGSFGGPVGGSAPGPADDPNAMDDGDSEDAESEDGDDDDDAEGTSGAGSTSAPPDGSDDDDDDAMGSTDDGGAGSSDGAGANPGDQPANGMWAPCVMDDFANCGAADTCVHLGADGFCTVQGCTNPAVDCDPAPAGTSVTPICADAVSTAVCALDCTAGSCPNGMACMAVAINEGPEYNICV